jgi:hypothetical protein
MGYADVDEVIAWADQNIGNLARPPQWLIDLSTDHSAHLRDFEGVLLEHAAELTKRERLHVTLNEHKRTGRPLEETLRAAFQIWVPIEDIPNPGTGDIPEEVQDLLVYLECWDIEPPPITAEFTVRCERAFSRMDKSRS